MRDVAEDLRATVEAAAPRLLVIGEAESGARPAPGKWSQKEILGHLIDSAANNHQRFVRAQLGGELAFPGYEQEGWVSLQQYRDLPWEGLVTLWRSYNLHLAHLIGTVSGERLATRCVINERDPVTLEFLMRDYVAHLKNHLGQIGAR